MNQIKKSPTISPKLIFILGALYILSPIDLCFDFLPIVGWFDDIGVLAYMIKTYIAYKKDADGQSIHPTEPTETVIIDAPFTTLEYKDS